MFEIVRKMLGTAEVETKAATLTDPAAYEIFGLTATTATGAAVGPQSAMKVPAVAAAAGLISETIGTLPAKLYDRADKSALDDHPAYKLVHDEANEWTSADELRRDLTLDALLYGSGYAQVIRLNDGSPFELHRLAPGAVRQDTEDDNITPVYIVTTDNGGQVRLPFTDVLHIQCLGGVSPIQLGREAIGLALAFEQHMGSTFANGGRPSGIIKADKKMDAEAKKALSASWFQTHSGKNAGSTALLDEGMDYETVSMTLADQQFSENRLEQIREIARHFRIPPTMLFELSRGTWANTEEMFRQFLTTTLKPWMTRWQWAYARCLLTPEERREAYVEFITDDLLTADIAARATAYGQYRSMGVLTANEVRSGLNKSPRPDGDNLQNPYVTTSTTTTGPASASKESE